MERSANFELYNPGGIFDDLLTKSRGFILKVGGETTLTGLTTGGTRSMRAGKETVQVNGFDYMLLLEHKLMLNSPFYDGLDLFNVIFDLELLEITTGLRDLD